MVQIGRFNRLQVTRMQDIGARLDAGRWGSILLPKRYVPDNCQLGDELDVFIYLDSEDRLIASTQAPKVLVGECASLKCVSIGPMGAFLDWGMPKDLFVPFAEMAKPMEEGKYYLVHVYLDNSNRLAASSKLDRFIDETGHQYRRGQLVDLLIGERTDLGYKAVINHTSWGLLYHSEIFKPIRKGFRIKGFIRGVREDGKVELSLEKPGYGRINDIAERVLSQLTAAGGHLPLSDKSAPEAIQETFGISKGAFKQAIGALYKQQLITIEKGGIRLVDEDATKA
ncbi:S1 RNA-binding domain-containing protein [Pokkaliibacter sp. CJK22405]|uniref:CvfB family protein n=1 Tax=Pokkaliibacter sp. CJK22405 TaxID=3384615 RepID=UPI00398531D8